MFIELVDLLRCVRPHEDGWLVLGADRMDGRRVVTGVLGCPVCGASYPVVEGEAIFGTPPDSTPSRHAHAPAGSPLWELDDAEAPVRLAALLGLEDVRQPVLLAGSWCALAGGLAAIVPARYLAVNPEQPLPPGREELAVLRVAGRLPIAAGKLRAAAIDRTAVEQGLLADVARAVRPGGRLVAPAAAPLPEGYAELARDATIWVAERGHVATGAPVPLSRAPRATGA